MIAKSWLASVLTFGFMTLTASAETNSSPNLSCCFHVPGAHLRVEGDESPSSQIDTAPGFSHATNASTSLEATLEGNDGEFQHFELTRSVPEDDLVSRGVDSIFRPEPIRVKKTVVSCSIWTAIKRRNPLCLLNPIVLNVSW